ncbi:lipopolysaccharide biosynthesis protein [Psychroflexus salis]|uniref:Lipopolysaccharide biosynthesis protein n=1 Tax=Psychroflexus salis TaxID=1526574 RepID=A0A916ZNL2_9FLAO|nr:lipopolysaccharide biosynthesis protein [Psychroflexus salis]GGE05064.1 lipopolysaccharide biosynthesis protein [Psychroflexus salis]
MLKQKALGGVAWSAVEIFSRQAVTFFVSILLARVLAPEDFGLIGMIVFIIAISNVLVNSGIGDALIRKRNPDDSYYNTAFLFNVLVGISVFIIIFFISPYIASFYNKPILKDLVRILSLSLVINSTIIVQRTIFIKKLEFKKLSIITFFSVCISGSISVIMAYNNYGVWSLVWKEIILALCLMFLFFKYSNWKPKLEFSLKDFKDMYGFGNKLMLLGLIDTVYQNIYFIVIGKFFSTAQLGQYTRAETFKRLPSNSISQIVQKVTYPVLSEIQDDNLRLKNSYKQILRTIMLVSITGMFLLSFIAKDLTVVLMGQQWELAGEYLTILCFSGLFYPLDALNTNILKVKNQSGKILKIGIYRKFLAIPLIASLIFYGMEPFLYGLILHQFLSFILISWPNKKLIDFGTQEQLKSVLTFFMINGSVYIIGVLISKFIDFNFTELTSLLIRFLLFSILILSILGLIRDKTLYFLLSTIKNKI